jgi:glucokinase
MIIGVDLGGTNIRVGLIDKSLIVEQKIATLTDKDKLPKTIAQIIDLIEPFTKYKVRGIGIGVPSVVDVERGIVFNVTNIPSWEKVELRSILQERFSLPVFVNNDVNCFILGEHQYGVARSYNSVVGLAMGTGLGAGIIINNALYNGYNCGAGEIGLLPYLDKNYEAYCSNAFFESFYNTTALDAFYAASKGNNNAIKSWAAYGIHLGNAIKAALLVFDPEALILGGSIVKAYNFFVHSMNESMLDFPFPHSIRRIKVIASQNENITLLGAASLLK